VSTQFALSCLEEKSKVTAKLLLKVLTPINNPLFQAIRIPPEAPTEGRKSKASMY
jgi:hypothetical protein